MARALGQASARRLSLTEQAFAFLEAAARSSSSVDDAVRATLTTLDGVGGPCRASGVFSLVKALASIGELDAAVWVIEEGQLLKCHVGGKVPGRRLPGRPPDVR